MAPVLLVGAAVAGLALVAVATGGASETGATTGVRPSDGGLDELVSIMTGARLPQDWQIFLAAVAWGESRWNSDVGLGPNDHPGRPPWLRPSRESRRLQEAEAKAALGAYRSNLYRLAGPWPEDRYTWGSGGLFGFLPPTG